jgi:hypothetical protein
LVLPVPRFRLQYRLSTLLVAMTVIAALVLPAWRFSRVWWQFRYATSVDVSRERMKEWMRTHPAEAERGHLSSAATQTQESDLPPP